MVSAHLARPGGRWATGARKPVGQEVSSPPYGLAKAEEPCLPRAQEGERPQDGASEGGPFERGSQLQPVVEAFRVRPVAEGSLARVVAFNRFEEVVRGVLGLDSSV
jgi:hypothetical protein